MTAMLDLPPQTIEALVGLVGVVWIVLGLRMFFQHADSMSGRRFEIPKRYGTFYAFVGVSFTVLSVASFRNPSAWRFWIAVFGAVVLLFVGVVGYRWIVREHVPGHDHADIAD